MGGRLFSVGVSKEGYWILVGGGGIEEGEGGRERDIGNGVRDQLEPSRKKVGVLLGKKEEENCFLLALNQKHLYVASQ